MVTVAMVCDSMECSTYAMAAATPTQGLAFALTFPSSTEIRVGILRADWELNAAMHNRDAISDQIIADVRTAYRQLDQAYKNLTILKQDIEPALVESLQIAKKGFEDGGLII